LQNPNTKDDLEVLFQIIDKKIDFKVILVSIGGTALTLMNIKEFSYDIDLILVSAENLDKFNQIYYETIKELGLPQGEHPLFMDFDISLLNITDYLQKSNLVTNISLKNVILYTMNILDILLSKNFRGHPKDKDDIILILNTKKVFKADLFKRYIELLKQQDLDIRLEFDKKYPEFMKDFGHLLY